MLRKLKWLIAIIFVAATFSMLLIIIIFFGNEALIRIHIADEARSISQFTNWSKLEISYKDETIEPANNSGPFTIRLNNIQGIELRNSDRIRFASRSIHYTNIASFEFSYFEFFTDPPFDYIVAIDNYDQVWENSGHVCGGILMNCKSDKVFENANSFFEFSESFDGRFWKKRK